MSAFWEILTAVKTALQQVDGLAGVPVYVRKRPFFSKDHGDTVPLVVISGGTEQVAELAMANKVLVDYPVTIALMQTKGSTLANETEYQWQLDRREEIRQALHKAALEGAASVLATKYEPEPPFQAAGLDNLVDLSLQQFWFRSEEARSV